MLSTWSESSSNSFLWNLSPDPSTMSTSSSWCHNPAPRSTTTITAAVRTWRQPRPSLCAILSSTLGWFSDLPPPLGGLNNHSLGSKIQSVFMESFVFFEIFQWKFLLIELEYFNLIVYFHVSWKAFIFVARLRRLRSDSMKERPESFRLLRASQIETSTADEKEGKKHQKKRIHWNTEVWKKNKVT